MYDCHRRSLDCSAGIGKWHWASNDGDAEPDGVLACCGDVPITSPWIK